MALFTKYFYNILIFKILVKHRHCPSWSLDLHFTLKICLVTIK